MSDRPAQKKNFFWRRLPLAIGGHLVLLVVALIVCSVRAHAADITWTNEVGGVWSDAVNWSPNQVPLDGDNALITTAGDYTVTLDIATTNNSVILGGPAGVQSLVITNTTLVVNGASTIGSGGRLWLTGSIIEGTGSLGIEGTMDWVDGTVTLPLNIAAGAALNLSGPGSKILGAAFSNAGTTVWSDGAWRVDGNSAFSNTGLFDWQAALSITRALGASNLVFSNTGTLRKSVSNSDVALDQLDLVSSGTIELQAGNFTLPAGTHHFGDNSILDGVGRMVVDGAHLILSGTLTANAALEIRAGQVSGTNTVVGTLEWTGGAIDAELGLSAGSFLNLSGTAVKQLNGGRITNDATINWTGSGALQGDNGAVIDNRSLFLLEGEGTMTHTSGASPQLLNSGTFRKTGLAAPVMFGSFTLTQSGIIDLQVGGVTFSSNTHTFLHGSQITGVGSVLIEGADIFVLGAQNISTPFELRSGTWTGTNSVAGDIDWTGGTISGSLTNLAGSQLRISGTATKTLDAATLLNLGEVIWTGSGALALSNGSIIQNLGVFDIQTEQSITHSGGAQSVFLNQGILRKSTGDNGAGFDGVEYQNYGTMEVLQGELAFTGGTYSFNDGSRFVGPGEWHIDGGTVSFSGTITNDAPFHLDSGILTGNATLTGGLIWTGGEISGQIAVQGPVEWHGGRLTGTLTVPAANTLQVLAGGIKEVVGTLNTAGTSFLNDQTLTCTNGATITNSGVMIFDGENPWQHTGGARSQLINTGTLRRTHGLSPTLISGVELHQRGLLDIVAGAIVFAANTHSFTNGSRIQGAGEWRIDGASVSLSGTITNGTPLHLNSGALLGIAALTGQLIWTGGELSGQLTGKGRVEWRGGRLTGALTIPTGNTLELLAGSAKEMAGTLNITGTSLLNDQTITCTNGATINNSGVMSFYADAPWIHVGGTRSRLNNTGTLRRVGGSGTTSIDGMELLNSGIVEVSEGTLSLSGSQHTFENGGTFVGTGLFTIDGGSVLVRGVQTISVPFELHAGTWSGTNSVIGTVDWTGGIISGAYTNPAGSRLRIGGSAVKTLDACTLVNLGEITWTGTGQLALRNGSVIQNFGLFDISTEQSMVHAGGAPSVFINRGVLRKSTGNSLASFSGVQYQNYGSVEILQGAISFTGGTYSFNHGSRFVGPGEWRIDGGTVTFSGTITNDAPFHLDSGVLTGNATLTGGLIWTGGEISGQITVKGPVEWRGGRLTGTLTVPVGSTLQVLAGGAKEVVGTLKTVGTSFLNDQSLTCTNGATITNSGVMSFRGTTPWVQAGGARSRLINTGTLRRVGDSATSSINEIELRNRGIIEVATGTFSLSGNQHTFEAGGSFIGSGQLLVDGANVLVVGTQTISVPFELRSGSWSGTNTVLGDIDWTGGTIRGHLTNALNNHFRISGTTTKVLDGATLQNLGESIWSGTGELTVENAALINNMGVFDLRAEQAMMHRTGTRSLFLNGGILRKSAGDNRASFNTVEFRNYGKLEILQGAIAFTGNTHSFTNGSRVVGPGQWQIDGGSVSLSGTITNDVPLRLDSGVLSGTATLTGGLLWTGGDISGQLIVKGPIEWRGGRLTGTMTVPAGNTLQLLAGAAKEVAGTLNAAGSSVLNDQTILCSSGATINNSGVMSFRGETPWSHSGGARPRLINTGTLRRTGAPGTTLISGVELRHQGIIDIAAGSIVLSANKHSFLDGARVEGVGSWAVDGADLTLNGAFQSTLPLQFVSGVVTGRVTYTGDMNWSGGTMSGEFTMQGPVTWAGGLLKGKLTMATNRALNIVPGSLKGIEAGVITNAGTMTVVATETIQCDNGSRVVNLGLLLSQSDEPFRSAWGTRSQVENFGTFRKNGAGTMNFREVELRQSGLFDILSGSVVYASGTHSFLSNARFTGAGSNVIAGATVSLNGFVTNTMPLRLESGILAANGSSIGTLLWTTGQITGALTIPTNSLFEMSGGGRKVLSGTIHELRGTSRLKGMGLMLCDNGVVVNNRGLFELEDDAVLGINTGATAATFNNLGTLRRTGGSGTNVFDKLTLNNSGVIDLRGGALRFPGGSHTFNAGSSVLGPGAVYISGASLNVNGSVTATAPFFLESGAINGNGTLSGLLTWSGGQISGQFITTQQVAWSGGDLTGTLTANGGVRWSGGRVMGTLTVPATATLTVRSGATRVLKGGTIQNAGIINMEASAPIQTDGGGTINNTGTFETWSDTPLLYMLGQRPVLNNTGTFLKRETNTMTFSMVELRNSGRFDIAGGLVALTSQSHSLNNGSVIAGTGLLRVDGATVTVAGTVIVSNEVQFASGTWTGGTTIRGRMAWSGGTFYGDLSIPAGSYLDVTSSAAKIIYDRDLIVGGTMAVAAEAQIQLRDEVEIINSGLVEFHSDTPWVQVGTDRPVIINSGTLRKYSAGVTSFGGIELNCTGTLDIRQGSILFSSSSHTLNNARLTGAGFARIAGSTVKLKGNVISSQAIQLASGEISDYGTFQGALTWTGGKLSGSHEISGGVTWQAGVLTGQLTIPTNGTLAVTGTGLKHMDAGVIENLGVMSATPGSSLRCDTAAVINNRGLLDLADGFQIKHLLNNRPYLNNYGVLSATNGLAPVVVQTELRQYSGGRLDLGLGERAVGTNSGRLQVRYSATLAGELRILLQNSLVPVEGDRFVILTGSPVSGTFSKVSGDNRLMSPLYTSSNVVMVCEAPKITVPPTARTIVLSNDTTFNVTATGTTPLRYQWFFNGGSLPGATNSSLALLDVPKSSEGDYFVVITNVWGAVTSSPVALTVNVPVTIITQPRSQTVIDDTDVTFEVAATGTAPITYQWRFKGTNIVGETNASLLVTNVTTADDGIYDVVVRNVVGPVTSAGATLTVLVRPRIVVQPTSRAAVINLGATFSVTATGTMPLSYQWRFNGANIVGATSSTLTLTQLRLNQAGAYSVLITNVAGTILSANANLTVNEPVVITAQPRNTSVTEGQSTSLVVHAVGTAPLTYQWRKYGVAISGATNATLLFPATAASQAGRYTVVVANIVGPVTSTEAVLTVNIPPRITQQPQSYTGEYKDKVDLEVEATGTTPMSYQWRRNGMIIPGVTSSSWEIKDLTSETAGSYTVTITNIAGSVTSTPAILALMAAPKILTQPVSQSVALGTNVTFSVIASGVPAPSYQWRLNNVWLFGATNASLVITNVEAKDSGFYSVIVYNSSGWVVSQSAELTVFLPTLPFSDNFGGAGILFSQTGAGRASNQGATRENGEPRHSRRSAERSMWISWWAPANGIATFSTEGSDFDTVIAAYRGDSLGSLVQIAQDDDSGGFHNSTLSFNAQAGMLYKIAVDGYKGAAGEIVLSWEMVVTQEKIPQITTAPLDTTGNTNQAVQLRVLFDAFDATQMQWFFQGLPVAGATQATLNLPILQTNNVGGYTIRLTASSGRTVVSTVADVQINTDGFTDVAARNKLGDAVEAALVPTTTPAAPSGPSTPGAYGAGGAGSGVARGYSGTQIFSTAYNTTDMNEPAHCGVSGGASSWFVYQPPNNGTLDIDTEGSSFDTVLAVYTGDGTLESLVPVACDNDSGADGLDSKVSFSVSAQTVYYIAVDGVNGARGTVILHYSLGQAPVITSSPASRSLAPQGSTVLTVQATANPNPSYQWFRNNVSLAGATNASHTISNFSAALEGTYHAVAMNVSGSAPSAAAYVLLDSPLRVVSCTLPDAGCVRLCVVGPAGMAVRIDKSTNLVNWLPISTHALTLGVLEFTDPSITNTPVRYYRAVSQP